jgi:hypothetical protein
VCIVQQFAYTAKLVLVLGGVIFWRIFHTNSACTVVTEATFLNSPSFFDLALTMRWLAGQGCRCLLFSNNGAGN